VYHLVTFLFRVLFSVGFRVRVTGRENVPSSGPLIICANHVSWLDPPLVAVVMPRQVHFVAKEELFGYPVIGWVLTRSGVIPVRRGQSDRRMIRESIRVLRSEESLGLFPEGTRQRTRQLARFAHGAAYLAVKCDTPVLPVGVSGEYGFLSTIRVRIGEPVSVVDAGEEADGRAARRENLDRITEAVRGQIEVLCDDSTDDSVR